MSCGTTQLGIIVYETLDQMAIGCSALYCTL